MNNDLTATDIIKDIIEMNERRLEERNKRIEKVKENYNQLFKKVREKLIQVKDEGLIRFATEPLVISDHVLGDYTGEMLVVYIGSFHVIRFMPRNENRIDIIVGYNYTHTNRIVPARYVNGVWYFKVGTSNHRVYVDMNEPKAVDKLFNCLLIMSDDDYGS